MRTIDSPEAKKGAMQTILVSDENYIRLKSLAEGTGHTIEGMIVEMISQQEADLQDEQNMDEAIRSPQIRSLLTQLHDVL